MARQGRHARHARHAGAGQAAIRAERHARAAAHGHHHHPNSTTAIMANTTSVPTVATTTTSATTTPGKAAAQQAPAAPQPLSPMVTHTVADSQNTTWSAATWTNGAPTSTSIGDIATHNHSGMSNESVTLSLNVNVSIGQITNQGGSSSTKGQWIINSDGTHVLTLDNTGGSTNPFSGSNAFIGTTSIANLTVNPAIVISNTALTIGSTSTGTVAIGVVGITGTGNLFVADSSTATINIAGTINNTGTLTIGKSDASTSQTGTGAITISGGIDSNVTNISNVAAGPVTLGAGAINNTGTITNSGSGNFTISGNIGSTVTNITLSGTGTATQTLSGTTINNTGTITNNGTTSGTTTISGAIGTNVTGVTENSSTSKLVLSGSNGSFSTGLNVTAGTVQASGANTNVFGTGTVTIGSTGVLDINGTSQSTGLLSGVAGASVTNSVAGVQTLTLSGTGSQSFAGAIGGGANLALTLSSGTQTLSGTNTYTGATKVNGGSLFVNGSTASGSAVTVNNSGTTLGGKGTINGSITFTTLGSGTNNLSPGASGVGSVGKLTVGALTLASTSNLNIDINSGGSVTGAGAGTVYDQVSTPGSTTNAITLNNAKLVVSTLPSSLAVGNVYYIVDNTSANADSYGMFSNVTPGMNNTGTYTDSNGDTFTVNYAAANPNDATNPLTMNDISLTVLTVVPEPSTWLAAALALGAVGYMQRRRLRELVRRRVIS